ncbi:glycosyltransferase [Granulicella arctica]|uniref:Glycosyltransferase involved in cell wall biosynthesis n=1 Tax=Granulicella arctica TaxID=940613 RepID=A0A7Y9PI75_9BACT|nr:glycosyltransferase [Granulicella arctica]NYF79611.1 glycosyltransferase involved in cell wall biosynthesis [Granulicella arctica]
MSEAIVIFRIQLLPRSETFIVKQAEAMRRFEPYFVGWRRVVGLEVPKYKSWTADDGGLRGKLRELRFRYLGPTSSEIARLRLQSPRLVYAHFALDGYAAMELAKQLGVPLVTALHGYDVTMSDEAIGATRLGREYLKGRTRLQKEGALFVACSAYVRSRAIERGYPAERTIVRFIGVDIARFEPPPTRRHEQVVLFVGRLVEKKGCKDLIEAMVEVQRRCAEAQLIVIGDGPLRASCEAAAATKRVRCRFLGAQSSAVVKDWMMRATVFCVPSVVATSGDAEGFGIVFIEAQAMGLPVVSTRSGGIPEAVDDGNTGLLVAEGDQRGLAEAILVLLQNNELWQRFSVAGRERVVEHFNLERQTQRLEDVFDEVLLSHKSFIEDDKIRSAVSSVSISSASNGSLKLTQNISYSESLSQWAAKCDGRSVDHESLN